MTFYVSVMSTSYLSHLNSRFKQLLIDFQTAGEDRRFTLAKNIEDIGYLHGQQVRPDVVMLADHLTELTGHGGLEGRYAQAYTRGVKANPALTLS